IAAGDDRALAEVARRHGPRLRGLALRFSGGMADADDIVQETFWTLWRRAGRWRPDGPPLGAWLARIAINRAIDGDRRRRVRRFFGLESAEDIGDPAVSAELSITARQELAAVRQDILALPPRQRAAILLAATGEHSNGEIAEALGLSLGAAEQLLVWARKTLRANLAARDASTETSQ
ncbi:MAG: sigma-70 family RNA polymerase sigma factor, partial [Bauldia sp.]